MLLLGKIALGMLGATVAGAGLLCSEGFINVNVNVNEHSRGDNHHIHVIAPALLVPIAVHLVPGDKLAKASDQIRPLLPSIHAALDGLADAPDLTLVEVSDPNEFVQVSKVGGSVVVDVAERDETVHVSVPLSTFGSAAEALADASSGTDAASFN